MRGNDRKNLSKQGYLKSAQLETFVPGTGGVVFSWGALSNLYEIKNWSHPLRTLHCHLCRVDRFSRTFWRKFYITSPRVALEYDPGICGIRKCFWNAAVCADFRSHGSQRSPAFSHRIFSPEEAFFGQNRTVFCIKAERIEIGSL